MPGSARPVVIVGDPVLHTPTAAVTEFDQALATLIEDMFATMYVAEGVGLAATQVGVGLSIFVYDCHDADGVQHRGHLINPRIVATSTAEEKIEEGCLSVPGPYAPLARPFEVTVAGQDQHGERLEVTGTGFLARCLIHETEHLAGTLYIDHLNRRKRHRILQEIEPFDWNAPLFEPQPS
ncbi:MAG: peptide deformylase [Pseudonocardiales bacterium]|jgi:peptide deformylase|nr:peptide deformylase [Pseudonocardiales bacterium]